MAKKRILSWLVAASLALSLLPAAALAADETEPAAHATPGSAFTDVVDKIDSTFTDPNETAASDLTNGTYDALNGTQGSENKTTEDFYTKDENGKDVVTGNVPTQVENANDTASELETDLKETTEKVEVPEFGFETKTDEDGSEKTELVQKGEAEVVGGKNLDQFMEDKANAAANAAGDGNKLVGEANDLIQDLNELVQAGKVETVQGIADEVAKKAEAANAAYKEAAIAHAEAEYALNAAKENYNAVISTALGSADQTALEKALEGKSLDDLTDEEKADLAIQLANADLAAARTALETAKGKLTDLKATYEAAETAKVIAEKYQAIADKMKDQKLTADQFIAILLDTDGWTAGENGPLGELDKTNFDNGGLTDTAVDYAVAKKDLEEKEIILKDLEADETAKNAVELTKEIQKNFSDLLTSIQGLPVNYANASRLQEKFDEYAAAIESAHGILRDPEANKEGAQDSANKALDALFDGKYLGAGVITIKNDLEALRNALWGHVTDAVNGRPGYKKVVEILGNFDKLETAEKAIRNSGYDNSVSNAKKAYSDADTTFKNVKLDEALANYLSSVGTDEKAAAATANKAAQLAAVLRAISDTAVKDAQGKAAAAAAAADQAAKDLTAAKEAYDAACAKLNSIQVNDDLDKATLKNLLKNAETQLANAKEALDKAKDNKDKADEIKKNADQAVEDAQERRDEINDELNNIITGDTDTGDDDTTIADGIVPLAGLIDRQTLVSYLYTHEGSPDGVDAEGEYTLALAWAVANDIVDEEDDPEELVTVAILRDVMTRYAKLLNRTFDVEIPGEDDDIVMNCDEILAEFFGD